MAMPDRKRNRLEGYDYSRPGIYFITICAREKRCLFGEIPVGDGPWDVPQVKLSSCGRVVEKYIRRMEERYREIQIEKYVIMPNHVHLLVTLCPSGLDGGTSQGPSPTNAWIPKWISLLKRWCNLEQGEKLWQRSYHDHIVRDQTDYLKIWEYIDTNPVRWRQDRFYRDE